MDNQSNRIYFMDSMRSVLMMLGIVLHSAAVYKTNQGWLIFSQDTSVVADNFHHIIHVFRMPTFFVISGFFCLLTINKYKPKDFLIVRLKRIFVPLLTTAVTLNIIQAIITTRIGFRQYDINHYFLDGGWVSHLWFLNNLIFYFLIAALLSHFLYGPMKIIGKYITHIFLVVPMFVVICLMPMASILIRALNQIGFPLYYELWGFLNVNDICIYLPYFIFGSILAGNRELLNKFSNFSPFIAILSSFLTALLIRSISFSNESLNVVTLLYLEVLLTWFSILICFFIFYRFFNLPSKLWSFLSGASYTVYLFHHVFVVAIGILLIKMQLPALIGMPLLMLTTIIITLCIHKYLILRSVYARLLFNGK